MQKIFFDKLFPWKHGVDRNKIQMDYECVHYVTVPRDSEKIVKLIMKKMEKQILSMMRMIGEQYGKMLKIFFSNLIFGKL